LPSDQRGPHMLGITLPPAVARRVGASLEERGVVAGVRGDSVRISPHLHVRAADVDRLIDGLAAAL
jgi:selenocysteine lyase/cysteine desulfurase